jgi:hypothetical protein
MWLHNTNRWKRKSRVYVAKRESGRFARCSLLFRGACFLLAPLRAEKPGFISFCQILDSILAWAK